MSERISEIMGELKDGGRLNANDWALVCELILIGGNCPQTPRTTAAERQKRYRERNVLRNGDVTNVTAIPPKKISNPPISPETLRVSTPRKTGTRLPQDWHPSENLWSWGKTKLSFSDETLKFETGAFRDHFWGVSGARGTKLDWEATWKNWMREAKRREKRKNPTVVPFVSSGPKRTWAEQRAETQVPRQK